MLLTVAFAVMVSIQIVHFINGANAKPGVLFPLNQALQQIKT